MNPNTTTNSTGGFFGNTTRAPNNGFSNFGKTDNDDNDIKKRNMDYMVNIRKSNRKDIIKNNRYKNMMQVNNELQTDSTQTNPQALIRNDLSEGGFPVNLSHLNRVKDAQRIYKILQDVNLNEPDAAQLASYFEVLKTGDRLKKHMAIIYIRKILSNKTSLPIQETIDLNGVPLLIGIAKDTSELQLRLEATWCLANLVSGTSEQTSTMINKNIIELFMSILDDQYPQIVEQAIWGLGNIIGDSLPFREKVVRAKVLPKLIELLSKHSQINIRKNIIWCLSNACRIRSKKENLLRMEKPVHTLLMAFNMYDDMMIKTDCLFGITEFCKDGYIKSFVEDTFLKNLRSFYQHIYTSGIPFANIKAEISAIHKIIGNITNGDDFDTTKIIDHGFLKDLNVMVKVADQMCKREICWILSNVAAGTSGQIEALMSEPGLFENLIDLLYLDNRNIQRESLWTICNMTKNCNQDQLNRLVANNILGIFSDLIGMDKDSKVIVLILEALPNIIEGSRELFTNENQENTLIDIIFDVGLADKISELQRHPSDYIYTKAIKILEEHFDLEEN